jgi:tyrosyl-tRNA synthetase
MKTNFVEELKWRGMLHDVMPGTEEQLMKEMTSGYIGFDPTADSLGVGNMVQVMTLVHFQRAGHKPYALIGGATGMVGDPSGKSQERNLLDTNALQHNLDCQQKQLEKFLDFDCGENSAEMVNNYDWFKELSFLDFIRDVGKHITVNYMMAKDSVKNRIGRDGEGESDGMSFTEFSYQLVQGYDFVYLNKNHNCKLQLGGSDQWGNITTGTTLIRKMGGSEAFALVTPLIKKADGTKFGKTESGNVWLDPNRTSPYQFYQFWLNSSDNDVKNYIRIFTIKSKEEIEALEAEHDEAPHLRVLQKALAEDITERVHSKADLDGALEASAMLFNKMPLEQLQEEQGDHLYQVLDNAKSITIDQSLLTEGVNIVEMLATETAFMPSKSEAHRQLKQNSISVNKNKVNGQYTVTKEDLLGGQFIWLQRGKKEHYIVKAV